MNRPIKAALALGVFGLLALTAKPPSTIKTPEPTPIHLMSMTGYTWHGYNTVYCPVVEIDPTCAGSLNWQVYLHVAVWANGTYVVMAHASGYPWCSANGYEIHVDACSYYGGGSQIYAYVEWTNCVLIFNLGCVSDTLTVGFNRYGNLDYWHAAWIDTFP